VADHLTRRRSLKVWSLRETWRGSGQLIAGLLAPHAAGRAQVVPRVRQAAAHGGGASAADRSSGADAGGVASRSAGLSWSTLLTRVFALACCAAHAVAARGRSSGSTLDGCRGVSCCSAWRSAIAPPRGPPDDQACALPGPSPGPGLAARLPRLVPGTRPGRRALVRTPEPPLAPFHALARRWRLPRNPRRWPSWRATRLAPCGDAPTLCSPLSPLPSPRRAFGGPILYGKIPARER
jgi:hypothetical protein